MARQVRRWSPKPLHAGAIPAVRAILQSGAVAARVAHNHKVASASLASAPICRVGEFGRPRQPHKLEITGSNPVPAPSWVALGDGYFYQQQEIARKGVPVAACSPTMDS